MIVIAEDRASHRVGVQIAVASIARHCPGADVVLHCPWADERFEEWARDRGVSTLHRSGVPRGAGWNVKPSLLLQHLRAGHDEVVWVDADVLTHRDWRPLLAGVGEDVLVATEETYWGQAQGGTHRTRAWGLEVGRSMPRTVNTGLVRVTSAHVELLEAWAAMLQEPTYREAQQQDWTRRPLHLLGDQEVLTALLGSAQFAAVPLRLLRQGVEIAQCYGPAGFTPRDRLTAALPGRSVPPLVHAMGVKPWERRARSGALGKLRSRYEEMHSLTSPYAVLAAAYRDELLADTSWMPRLPLGRGGERAASLAELPLATVDHAVRAARRVLGIGRYEIATDLRDVGAPSPSPLRSR
ncbi:nucleotide-diphospho-sugar transferase [Kineococcus sp. SYSU DK002]|uniref:nucleotide-diphospho-sugar transferase n=1 Tax=Kineococcus sp. SYSU DK002 TaxID=3383123 RepID=UPI003D7CBF81